MAKLVKVIEVLAQSDKSWDHAAQQAVGEASKTLRNIRSIYVKESKRQSRTVKSPNTASTQKSRSTSKSRERVVGAKRDSAARGASAQFARESVAELN